jgi:predicted dehydrogenase
MDSRRRFIGTVATGIAGTLAAGPARVLGANDRIRVGILGAGDRGLELMNHVRSCSNTEIVAFCDIYNKRLDTARHIVPSAQVYADYRAMLEDGSIDGVVIATPQHLHAEHFCAALDAGRHVYQERTMAFTVAHAKRMRAAFQRDNGKHVVQIGHQSCSFGQMSDVRQFLSDPKRIGKITAIVMHMYRNTPRNKAQWLRPALLTPEVNAENVAWNSFLGDAKARDFDPERFIHWRLYSDYSGGAVHEYMSQQLGFWYKALNLQIPRSATMHGGTFLWKDGRELPDTASVALEQPEELLINWSSGFGNNQLGVSEDVLGDQGTISRASQVRYIPQKINRPDGTEMTGRATHAPHVHMQNFFDCIRSGAEPNCCFDLGYRVSIACHMAVESYQRGRAVRWDPKNEEIV